MKRLLLDEPRAHKEKVHCIYLDKQGYVKWYLEYWGKRLPVTIEKAENSWNRVHKEPYMGKGEYRQLVDHRGWNSKDECEIARKYGYETVEVMEWIDL